MNTQLFNELVEPLFESTNISWFFYLVVNLEDQTVSMISNLEGFDTFRKDFDFPLGPLFLDSGYYWWPDILPPKQMEIYKALNVDNIFTIIKRDGKFSEDYSFGTTTDNDKMINYYLNNIDMLESFIDHFNKEGLEIRNEAKANMTKIPERHIDYHHLKDVYGSPSKSPLSTKKHLESFKDVTEDRLKSRLLMATPHSEPSHHYVNLQSSVLSNISKLITNFAGFTVDHLSTNSIVSSTPIDAEMPMDEILKDLTTPLCILIANLSSLSGKSKLAAGDISFLKNSFKLKLPPEDIFPKMGVNAMRFLRRFSNHFNDNIFLEPITRETIRFLNVELDKIGRDITDDQRWPDLINTLIDVLAPLEDKWQKSDLSLIPIRRDTFRETIKQWILMLYRESIIQLAMFQKFKINSTIKVAHEPQFYVRMMVDINESKSKQLTTKECAYKLLQKLQSTLGTSCDLSIQKVLEQIQNTGSSKQTVRLIEKEIQRIQSSPEYICLGSKAKDCLDTLLAFQEKYSNLISFINEEVKELSLGFIPNPNYKLERSVKDLIENAAHKIENSSELKAIGSIGLVIIKNYLMSDNALNQIHARAIHARTEYFSKFIPKQMNSLSSDQVGINWLKYPNSKTECIKALYSKYIDNPNPVNDICSNKQKSELLKLLQQLYLNAMLSHYKEYPHVENVYQTLNDILEDSLFQIDYEADVKGLDKSEIDKNIAKLKNILQPKHSTIKLNKSQKSGQEQNRSIMLFSKSSPPQYDIAIGLLNKLHTKQKEGALLLEDAEIESTLKKSVKPEENLFKLLYFKDDHEKLSQLLFEINDPKKRMEKIKDIFEFASESKNFSDYKFLSTKLEPGQFTAIQTHAIKILQDLYIKALEEAWIQRANSLSSKSNNMMSIPETLSVEGKTIIYRDLLKPAVDEPIINCLVSNDRMAELVEMVFEMQNTLLDIPEPKANLL